MRFVFVSLPAWGHVDFGGRGFVRTAAELRKRGHSVTWLFDGAPTASSAAVSELLGSHGIPYEWTEGSVFRGPHGLPESKAVAALARRWQGVGAVAIDRRLPLAGIAAHLAGISWAAVGTNGLAWTPQRELGVSPGEPLNDPRLDALCVTLGVTDSAATSRGSLWAISPHLNISFLPGAYYVNESPPHSHFVGNADAPRTATRTSVVVTLGTTVLGQRRDRLVRILAEAQQRAGAPWRLLAAGGIPGAVWEPYDTAFATATIAVGHGGNAFLWQAMREGIPALVIPLTADQYFGGQAVARLGMGQTVDSDLQATADWIATTVHDLQRDSTTRNSAAAVRAIVDSGGGVQAAASLMERLAETRRPVTDCVRPRCCCEATP